MCAHSQNTKTKHKRHSHNDFLVGEGDSFEIGDGFITCDSCILLLHFFSVNFELGVEVDLCGQFQEMFSLE